MLDFIVYPSQSSSLRAHCILHGEQQRANVEIGKQNKEVLKKKMASRVPLSKMRITLNAEQLTSLQLYTSHLRGESEIHHREGGKEGGEEDNFRFRSVFSIYFFSFLLYPPGLGFHVRNKLGSRYQSILIFIFFLWSTHIFFPTICPTAS